MKVNDKSNNWQMKKLGEIIIENKKSILKSKGNNDGIYPFFVSGFNTKKIDNYLIDGKSIFLPTGGNFFVHYFDGKCAYSTDTWSIRTTNNVDIRYLYYYLILNQDYIGKKLFKGATIKHLQKNDLRDLKIMTPSLPEQQRIVKILDEVFENIAKAKENAEKNLANSKELFESYLQNVFINSGSNWEDKKLNDISDNLDNKRIPITKNVRSSGEYPYYGASGVVDYVGEYIFDDDLLLVSEDGANLLARTYPIAFSVTGKLWVNNHAHILKFEDIESQKFVEYYLNSIKLDPYVSGMAQPKLNQKMLNLIPIPYPSLSEQRSIVTKLDALSSETKKLELIYKQKIADLDELKKSILQKAFVGEL